MAIKVARSRITRITLKQSFWLTVRVYSQPCECTAHQTNGGGAPSFSRHCGRCLAFSSAASLSSSIGFTASLIPGSRRSGVGFRAFGAAKRGGNHRGPHRNVGKRLAPYADWSVLLQQRAQSHSGESL